ncbi:MAG: glycosyltransferase [Microthrixaceae bacterium]
MAADRRARAGDRAEDPLVLLVTSSGGHLSHLLELAPFWQARRRAWVSFEVPDAVSRLDGEDVIWAYHPTTRNVINLVRNLYLAWRELRRRRPALIVSTGAGVAVPFFWLGRRFGARTVFLEVYDRIDSATMTGRLVRRTSDAMLVQWPEQAGLYPNAEVMGTIWPDSPPTEPGVLDEARDPARRPLVLVTVGTDHHPYDRLVSWAAQWADEHEGDAQVVIQHGTSPDPGGAARRAPAMDSAELLGWMRRADAVVCAAGPGTLMDALHAGVRPIVVPRRPELGEHVDGHQVAFAGVIGERGVALRADSAAELRRHLDGLFGDPDAMRIDPLPSGSAPGVARVTQRLEQLL